MARHRILVVDSDADTREVLRHYLEHHGYEVLEAATGEEGLRLAREYGPALVLGEFPMDVPGHSPFVDALRQEAGSSAPVVAFTARARKRDIEAARQIAQLVITKPASPSTVLEQIRPLLSDAEG